MLRAPALAACLLAACACIQVAQAQDRPGGKLLATPGITQFEGAAGGGLVPWATIGSYATEDEIGASAFATVLATDEYRLQVAGFLVGIHDRLELSYARQSLSVSSDVTATVARALVGALGGGPAVGPGSVDIAMDVYGAKLRLAGDAIYAQDTWMPQVALGVQHKRHRDFDRGTRLPAVGDVGIPALLGAADANGTDVYLSATKLLLGVPAGRNLLLNATVRATRGNAFGLLGFGRRVVDPVGGGVIDRRDDGWAYTFEGSAALFVDEHWVLGGEWRTQANRLDRQPVLAVLGDGGLAREDTAWDLFVAWLPSKRFALTAAWVDVGRLPFDAQAAGPYISAQASF
jgi:hypothetical protein